MLLKMSYLKKIKLLTLNNSHLHTMRNVSKQRYSSYFIRDYNEFLKVLNCGSTEYNIRI